MTRPFVRKFVARDARVRLHFLQVDVVRAVPYDVDDAFNETLVLAMLHRRWLV
jgi:hypothetical protein